MSENCVVCKTSMKNRQTAAFIEYTKFIPEQGEAINPQVCRGCARDGIGYCWVCDKGFYLSEQWQEKYYGINSGNYYPANYRVILCPDHEGAPSVRCDVCERMLPYEEQCVTALDRVYCTGCMDNVVRCGNHNCRLIIHPQDKGYTHTYKRVRYCLYCHMRKLPEWIVNLGVYHESMWKYSATCPCSICRFLNVEAPRAYPSGTILDADSQCDGCELRLHTSELHDKAGGHYCHTCYSQGFIPCDHCGTDTHRSTLRRVMRKDGRWCKPCVKALKSPHWLCNVQCETWFPKGTECPCGGVYGYNYVPSNPPFLTGKHEKAPQSDVPFLGLELEVEASTAEATRRKGAKLVSDLAPWAYPMHDGSLRGLRGDGTGGEFGFEVVTYPFTLQWLEENWLDFTNLLAGLSEMGFRSWESERCGMHIHISRAPMTDAHQMKFIRFILGHSNLCVAVGERGYRSRGVSHYASFNAEDRSKLIYKVREHQNPGVSSHRVALNTNKAATLEGRWFRGSLNPSSIRRNLEFMHSVWYFTRKFGMTSSNEFNYINWLRGSPESHQYATLLDFIERNYVTRPWKGVRRSR